MKTKHQESYRHSCANIKSKKKKTRVLPTSSRSPRNLCHLFPFKDITRGEKASSCTHEYLEWYHQSTNKQTSRLLLLGITQDSPKRLKKAQANKATLKGNLVRQILLKQYYSKHRVSKEKNQDRLIIQIILENKVNAFMFP
jgi:peroxiredoxin